MILKYHREGIDEVPNDHGLMMFMGFPSAKDPQSEQQHPGKSTCCIISEAQRSWFSQWQGGKSGKRSAEYEDRKKLWVDRMLSCLYRLFPETKGRVTYTEVGSPLTNEFYLGRAASYGLEPSRARFTSSRMAAVRPAVSALPGMYLVGQDVATAGWAGALSSAMMTAMVVLGYGFMDLVVFKRNLIEDIMNLPPLSAPVNSEA